MAEQKVEAWLDEARVIAAQCWCDDETKHIVMEPALAEAVARRIAAWMRTGAEYATNAEYWQKQASAAMSDSKATTARKHWTEDAVKACKASGRWILKRSRFGDGSAEVMSEVTVGFLAGYDCAKRAHPPAAPEVEGRFDNRLLPNLLRGLGGAIRDAFKNNNVRYIGRGDDEICDQAAALLQSRDATIEGLRAELAGAKQRMDKLLKAVEQDGIAVGADGYYRNWRAEKAEAALAARQGG